MSSPSEQARIWSHFQNEGADSFAGATARLDRVAREVRKRAGRDARVLTIGVGDGHLERTLASGGAALTALDPDDRAVDRLRSDGLDARVGLIEALPFPEAEFDAVVASEVLEHLNETEGRTGLTEIRRVLRPGGWFVGTTPADEDLDGALVVCPHCGERFHRWGHVRSFDRESLRSHLATELEPVLVRRTAFVRLRRSPAGIVKSAARWALAALGSPIASPNLFFVARKRVG